jgi:hypothetical protein
VTTAGWHLLVQRWVSGQGVNMETFEIIKIVWTLFDMFMHGLLVVFLIKKWRPVVELMDDFLHGR